MGAAVPVDHQNHLNRPAGTGANLFRLHSQCCPDLFFFSPFFFFLYPLVVLLCKSWVLWPVVHTRDINRQAPLDHSRVQGPGPLFSVALSWVGMEGGRVHCSPLGLAPLKRHLITEVLAQL